jgi:hypothetical protein
MNSIGVLAMVCATGCVGAINEPAHETTAYRDHRIALSAAGALVPQGGVAERGAVGGDLDYFVTDRLSVGVSGREFVDGDGSATARRLTSASGLQFGYTLLDGGALGTPYHLVDVYAVSGIGVVGAGGKARIAFDVGLGLRHFFTPWLAGSLEVRDLIYTAPGADPMPGENPNAVPAAMLENTIELGAQLSFFLPTLPTSRR